jgi:hypothetical protein
MGQGIQLGRVVEVGSVHLTEAETVTDLLCA